MAWKQGMPRIRSAASGRAGPVIQSSNPGWDPPARVVTTPSLVTRRMQLASDTYRWLVLGSRAMAKGWPKPAS